MRALKGRGLPEPGEGDASAESSCGGLVCEVTGSEVTADVRSELNVQDGACSSSPTARREALPRVGGGDEVSAEML